MPELIKRNQFIDNAGGEDIFILDKKKSNDGVVDELQIEPEETDEIVVDPFVEKFTKLISSEIISTETVSGIHKNPNDEEEDAEDPGEDTAFAFVYITFLDTFHDITRTTDALTGNLIDLIIKVRKVTREESAASFLGLGEEAGSVEEADDEVENGDY